MSSISPPAPAIQNPHALLERKSIPQTNVQTERDQAKGSRDNLGDEEVFVPANQVRRAVERFLRWCPPRVILPGQHDSVAPATREYAMSDGALYLSPHFICSPMVPDLSRLLRPLDSDNLDLRTMALRFNPPAVREHEHLTVADIEDMNRILPIGIGESNFTRNSCPWPTEGKPSVSKKRRLSLDFDSPSRNKRSRSDSSETLATCPTTPSSYSGRSHVNHSSESVNGSKPQGNDDDADGYLNDWLYGSQTLDTINPINSSNSPRGPGYGQTQAADEEADTDNSSGPPDTEKRNSDGSLRENTCDNCSLAMDEATSRSLLLLSLCYDTYNSPVPAPFLRFESPHLHITEETGQAGDSSIPTLPSTPPFHIMLTEEKQPHSTVHIGELHCDDIQCKKSTCSRTRIVAKIGFSSSEKSSLCGEYTVYKLLHEFGVKGVAKNIGLFIELDECGEEVQGPFALVLSYVGSSLHARAHTIPKEAKLSLLSTLDSIHALGIVHGDIAGDNMCILDSGEVSIINFSHAWTGGSDEEKEEEFGTLCEELQIDIDEAISAIRLAKARPGVTPSGPRRGERKKEAQAQDMITVRSLRSSARIQNQAGSAERESGVKILSSTRSSQTPEPQLELDLNDEKIPAKSGKPQLETYGKIPPVLQVKYSSTRSS